MKKRIIVFAIGAIIFVTILILSRVFLVRTICEVYDEGPVTIEEGTLTELSGIQLGDSILSIDEKAVKERIHNMYPDMSVEILDIERVFPNTVIIKAKERIPVLTFDKKGEEGTYTVTDINFRINTILFDQDDVPEGYIHVTGVLADTSYNLKPFRQIEDALTVVTEFIPDYALTSAIDSIDYADGNVTIFFKNGQTAVYSGDKNTFKADLNKIL